LDTYKVSGKRYSSTKPGEGHEDKDIIAFDDHYCSCRRHKSPRRERSNGYNYPLRKCNQYSNN
jgi:hypothetical protein